MKLIALDVGSKRIGIAKADSSVRIAIPYSAVEVDGTEFKKIASLARAWDINSFVIGLPRNSKGEETEQSKYVRKFAAQLKREIEGAKVCFQDESLTSVEAEKRLKSRKKGYKKGDIDSEAAAIILQDFLEQKTGKPTTRAAAAKHKSIKGAKKSNRLATVIVAIVVLLGIAAAVSYGYYRYNLRSVAGVDLDCSDSGNVVADECEKTKFVVESGSSVDLIASNLKEAGLIRDRLVFQVYVRLNSGHKSLKAGEYNLSKAMSVAEITDLLLQGSGGNVFGLTILPGETIIQIKKKLVDLGYNSETVNAAFAKSYTDGEYSWIFEGKPENTSLEGYIYGETYEFYRDENVEAIIERTLEEMAHVLKENDLKAKFEAHGLNLYQGITLASIVQREANSSEAQAKVAQIFYNRLRDNIPLGSDVTVKYAAELAAENGEVYESNAEVLGIDSPYNTRKYPGLPIGPISNPGLSALLATAEPDESASEYLFFLTGDDGLMYYSTTDAGHQQNIIDHCQQLCNVPLY